MPWVRLREVRAAPQPRRPPGPSATLGVERVGQGRGPAPQGGGLPGEGVRLVRRVSAGGGAPQVEGVRPAGRGSAGGGGPPRGEGLCRGRGSAVGGGGGCLLQAEEGVFRGGEGVRPAGRGPPDSRLRLRRGGRGAGRVARRTVAFMGTFSSEVGTKAAPPWLSARPTKAPAPR